MKSTRFGVSVSCLVAVSVFSLAAAARAADTTLRWKFAAGQKRAFVLSQKVALAAEVQGRKIETSFTQTTEMSFGTMAMDMKYTLESPSGSIENIGVDVKVDLEPKADTPAEVKVKSQEMKGHYTFDNTEGILKSSNVVQKIGLMLTVQGREIAQDLESTIKMELKPEGGSKK